MPGWGGFARALRLTDFQDRATRFASTTDPSGVQNGGFMRFRNAIFAGAFGANPEFFEFYRSLTAYQRSLQAGNSTLVLSPDSEFFNYLRDDNPFGVSLEPVVPEADGAAAEDTGDSDGSATTGN